jgi:hypothetical protein
LQIATRFTKIGLQFSCVVAGHIHEISLVFEQDARMHPAMIVKQDGCFSKIGLAGVNGQDKGDGEVGAVAELDTAVMQCNMSLNNLQDSIMPCQVYLSPSLLIQQILERVQVAFR